jgi:hypothetical protein
MKHEKTCYFNPETRSCAGCAALFWLDKFDALNKVPKKACLQNIDISAKMKTNCKKFVDIGNYDDCLELADLRMAFPQFNEALARMRWHRNNSERVIQIGNNKPEPDEVPF